MNLEDALCRGKWWLFDSTVVSDHLEARELCGRCPELAACTELLREVQTDCRTLSKSGGGPVGTWAGRFMGTGSARGRTLPREHGTERGYYQHRNLREEACAECCAAHVAEVADYQARRRLVEDETCGRGAANPESAGTIETVPEARSQRPLAPRPQPPMQEEVLAVTLSLPSPDAPGRCA